MSKPTIVLLTLVALLTVAITLPALGVSAGPPDGATMQFGRPDTGSGCNFPCEDDRSFHAVDKIQPGAIQVAAGETVDFAVVGFHQVGIYKPGINPDDIEPVEATFPFVDDDDGRKALGALTLDFDYKFTEPGKYLVICNIAPHFVEAQMWGWVIVQ